MRRAVIVWPDGARREFDSSAEAMAWSMEHAFGGDREENRRRALGVIQPLDSLPPTGYSSSGDRGTASPSTSPGAGPAGLAPTYPPEAPVRKPSD